jgi:hypothetical protein
MKQLFLAGICLIICLGSFAQNDKVIRDPNAKARNVKDFHGIHISNGIDLYLSQGSEEAVAVSASSEEYRDKIRTEVEDGVLKIFLDEDWRNWTHWGNRKLKAYVSVRNLDKLEASGGSDIYPETVLKSERMDVRLSGGSDFKDGRVDIGDLHIVQTGGSDVSISGKVGSLQVRASGGSDLHGFDLVAESCNISASGGSDTRITVNKELTVSASGGSDVYYRGTGNLKGIMTSGSSSVTRKD